MTAKQARELSERSVVNGIEKALDGVLVHVRCQAKDGLTDVRLPLTGGLELWGEIVIDRLKKLNYTVVVDGLWVNISW